MRTVHSGHALLWIALVLAATANCSGSSNADAVGACAPGQSIQCAGVNGCVGAQVCRSDGAGYDACLCANEPGVGSSSATGSAQAFGGMSTGSGLRTGGTPFSSALGGWQTLGGQTGLGGSVATGGVNIALGGNSTVAQGGSTNCAPASMSGYAYPAYKPARHMANACTDQAIQLYYTDCYAAGNCAAFTGSGTYASCGACLDPTPLSADRYGPILFVGPSSLGFYETNVAGCEELVGATSCAPTMQVEFLCEYYSCASSCPLSDSASFDAIFQCMSSAQGSTCAKENAASHCLTSSAQVAACSGSTFQAQFLAIAKVFCQ